MTENTIEAAVEAILFTMGDAVETDKIAKAIGKSVKETRQIVDALAEKYQETNRGMQIIALDDAYQMCTKAEMYEYLIKVASQPKKQSMTPVLLETLSIIAYRQPVTKLEIEKIRGVKSDHAVNKLVEYELVEEAGRLEAPGRPILFQTTREFLRRFGLSTVQDLPPIDPEKVESFKTEAEKEVDLKLQEED